MKSLSMFAVAVFFSAGAAFAQTDTPAPAAPSSAVTGFRITRITGTVNIIKDGKVLVTLNPGDAVPAIEGGWITFAVVEGTLELEAAGKTITAATGSNFTVGSVDGRMDISVAAGTPAAAAPPEPGQGRLSVTVREGDAGLAVNPTVTVCALDRPDAAPLSLSDNPCLFSLVPGRYRASAHVGQGAETPPTVVEVVAGQTVEVVLNTGTGTLVLTLAAGGQPVFPAPQIQILSGGQMVAALNESPARFQLPAGSYRARIQLSAAQAFEVPGDLVVTPGGTLAPTVEVPCAHVSVTVNGGGHAPGSGRFPYVEITQAGRMVAALSDNPARFLLLAGQYEMAVVENGQRIGVQPLAVSAGPAQAVTLSLP
ncbi:MAG: hypothetical protein BWZ02_03324 [Lentisphaerae bacterium ADurb.BinA184]|nr:MAG: hypothetical protein BWZ02_03324 [Lentisphaerae bacterium ADurb.BinA184]